MDDFWSNVSRYPRFFISSLAGLILIILTPFRNLLKVKKFQVILSVVILALIVFLYNILLKMAGL